MKAWIELSDAEKIERLAQVCMQQNRLIERIYESTSCGAIPGLEVIRIKLSMQGENEWLGAWPHLDQTQPA